MTITDLPKTPIPLLESFQVGDQITFWDREAQKSESQCPFPKKDFLELIGNTSKILDIGCGTGRILTLLRNKGYKLLFGLDWSHVLLRIARNRLKEIEICVGDCRFLPYRDQSFDVCIFSAVLTCFINRKDLLYVMKEAYRVLKLGGVVFVSDFLLNMNPRNFIRYVIGFIKYRHWVTFSAGQPFSHFKLHELCSLLSSVGFRIASTNIVASRSWHGHDEKGVHLICFRDR